MFLEHVQTRVDAQSNYFWICTPTSTPDFGPSVLCMARGRLAVWHRAAALQENVRTSAWTLCAGHAARGDRSQNVNPSVSVL